MKRIIAVLLAALMLIGLAACGAEKPGAEETLPETTSENSNNAAEAEGIRVLTFDWEAEKEKTRSSPGKIPIRTRNGTRSTGFPKRKHLIFCA